MSVHVYAQLSLFHYNILFTRGLGTYAKRRLFPLTSLIPWIKTPVVLPHFYASARITETACCTAQLGRTCCTAWSHSRLDRNVRVAQLDRGLHDCRGSGTRRSQCTARSGLACCTARPPSWLGGDVRVARLDWDACAARLGRGSHDCRVSDARLNHDGTKA